MTATTQPPSEFAAAPCSETPLKSERRVETGKSSGLVGVGGLLDSIVCGNNREVLAQLPSECVDLTVTSPPYNCGMDYGTESDDVPWEQYWNNARAWLVETLRVTTPGGRLAVNLPWWMGKKPRRDVPYEFQRTALEAGWLMLDKIIWVKGDAQNVHTSGGFGGGGCGWGTYMSPSGPVIRCASEPILIFAKGSRGRGVVSGAGRGACVAGDMTKAEWMEWTLDVWFMRGETAGIHPAAFPVEIPARLIKLYTYQGDTVLDPFVGSGTTCKAAKALNRHWLGIEIDPAFARLSRAQLAQDMLPLFLGGGGAELVAKDSCDSPKSQNAGTHPLRAGDEQSQH
jgi:site-specific DNA-methyltransferase (adenine-specific)